MSGWIGVDLDGTLAEYQGYYAGAIGAPIRPMLVRAQDGGRMWCWRCKAMRRDGRVGRWMDTS